MHRESQDPTVQLLNKNDTAHQPVELAVPFTRGRQYRPGELQEESWRSPRWQRRGSDKRNVGRCNGLQSMRQR